MSDDISISVIIPTYNPGLYIFDCLNSLNSQRVNFFFEIILVFNGTHGEYYEKIVDYLKFKFKYSYQVLSSEKKGVSAARNLGINLALGEYLCFIDDDDIVSSLYLKELFKCSSCNCVAIANSYSFVENIDNAKKNFLSKAFLYTKKLPFSRFKYRRYFSTPCAKLFHKDIISDVRFDTNLTISEDGLFMFTISPYICEMKHTSSNSVYYIRERSGSATRKKMSFISVLQLTIKIQLRFFRVYLASPQNFDFLFFFTRIAGLLKHGYILWRK